MGRLNEATLQIEITAREGLSSATEGNRVLNVPQKAGGKICPHETGKWANLLSVYWGTAAEASCYPAPSYGSRAPTNACLMTRFIHPVTMSSSLPLCFR